MDDRIGDVQEYMEKVILEVSRSYAIDIGIPILSHGHHHLVLDLERMGSQCSYQSNGIVDSTH